MRTRPTLEELGGDDVGRRAVGWTHEVAEAVGREGADSVAAGVTDWNVGAAVVCTARTVDVDGEWAAGIWNGVTLCAVSTSTAHSAVAPALAVAPTWSIVNDWAAPTSADTLRSRSRVRATDGTSERSWEAEICWHGVSSRSHSAWPVVSSATIAFTSVLARGPEGAGLWSSSLPHHSTARALTWTRACARTSASEVEADQSSSSPMGLSECSDSVYGTRSSSSCSSSDPWQLWSRPMAPTSATRSELEAWSAPTLPAAVVASW
mmetsp:Transcript_6549/g.11773  ORF Transcript_6549/g.11773 Transcript_6549/m.11773 type:complete len:264 (+) Transcript_6549:918-1709(+)